MYVISSNSQLAGKWSVKLPNCTAPSGTPPCRRRQRNGLLSGRRLGAFFY